MDNNKRILILLTTSISSFLTPFTSSIITFAVPRIGEYFRADFFTIIWVPISYLIPLPLMILFGRLSDIYGKIIMYRLGLIIFTSSIFIAIFSINIYMLIITLFIAGIGGSLFGINATAIISHVYSSNRRGRALGINAMSVYLGLTLSPFLGGILIQIFNWQSIFYAIFPISLTALLISFYSMKDIEFKNKREKLDVIGSILFASSLIMIVFYLTLSVIYNNITTMILLILGILFLIVFIYHETKIDEPLIDFNLFRNNRTFIASNISAFLNYLSTYSIVFVFSIYLQVFLKIPPFQAGSILIFQPIFMVIFSPISGRLSDKYGSRILASIGMAIIGSSFIALSIIKIESIFEIIIPLSFIGIGFGLFTAPNTNSVMGSVEKDKYGIAAGTLGTMRFTGQILSISVASAFLSNSVPKNILLGLFTGAVENVSIVYINEFLKGFRLIMLFSGIMSFIGAYTSLLKREEN
ncbi:MAG: MFS transporter [Thermoplasmata archaeon]